LPRRSGKEAVSGQLSAKGLRNKKIELEYHLLLSHDLGILNEGDFKSLSEGTIEIKQMLTSFIKKLKADC
jgi:four helix bundle protein